MTFTADFFEFISKNIDAEPNRLRLKYYNATEYSFDMGLAIAQIECRQRIRRKLPSIAAEPRFLFPSTLLAEQCTDELVAQSSVRTRKCVRGRRSMLFLLCCPFCAV